MHLGRLRTGERIAGVSAMVLLISTFLDWFVIEIPDTTGVAFFLDGTGRSAWDALDFIPAMLVVTVLVVVSLAALRVTGAGSRPLWVGNAFAAALGLLSSLLILFRIFDPPAVSGSFEGAFGGTVTARSVVQIGIFIGLLSAAGIAFGGYRAMIEERSSVEWRRS